MLPPGGFLLTALLSMAGGDTPRPWRQREPRTKRKNPKRQNQKAQRIARKKSRRSAR